jgi:hypothetical protein
LILLLQYKTKKLFSPTLLILFLLFGPLIALGIYQENIHPHYLSFLFPLVPLVFAAGFYYKYSRFLAYIFAIFVVAWVLPTTVSYISSGPTLQSDRAANIAEYINGQINQEPYNLVSNSITNTTPYQYYAYISPNPPSILATSDVFLICQDVPCTEQDIQNKQLFVTGPAHPTLANYTGHPPATYVVEDREIISNEHISMGVWVAHLKLTSPE